MSIFSRSTVALFLFLAACEPGSYAPTHSPAANTVAPAHTPVATQHSSTETPSHPATPYQRPYILARTTYPDGGDEFSTCLRGFNRPDFILYEDGELIVLRGSYQASTLAENEIENLLDHIAKTGLLEQPTDWSTQGWTELNMRGRRFYLPGPESDPQPFTDSMGILDTFQPGQPFQRYSPETVMLDNFRIEDLSSVEHILPRPIKDAGEWTESPLHKFGIDRRIVSGQDAKLVMSQFEDFPGVRLFRDNGKHVVSGICADFSWWW